MFVVIFTATNLIYIFCLLESRLLPSGWPSILKWRFDVLSLVNALALLRSTFVLSHLRQNDTTVVQPTKRIGWWEQESVVYPGAEQNQSKDIYFLFAHLKIRVFRYHREVFEIIGLILDRSSIVRSSKPYSISGPQSEITSVAQRRFQRDTPSDGCDLSSNWLPRLCIV